MVYTQNLFINTKYLLPCKVHKSFLVDILYVCTNFWNLHLHRYVKSHFLNPSFYLNIPSSIEFCSQFCFILLCGRVYGMHVKLQNLTVTHAWRMNTHSRANNSHWCNMYAIRRHLHNCSSWMRQDKCLGTCLHNKILLRSTSIDFMFGPRVHFTNSELRIYLAAVPHEPVCFSRLRNRWCNQTYVQFSKPIPWRSSTRGRFVCSSVLFLPCVCLKGSYEG